MPAPSLSLSWDGPWSLLASFPVAAAAVVAVLALVGGGVLDLSLGGAIGEGGDGMGKGELKPDLPSPSVSETVLRCTGLGTLLGSPTPGPSAPDWAESKSSWTTTFAGLSSSTSSVESRLPLVPLWASISMTGVSPPSLERAMEASLAPTLP